MSDNREPLDSVPVGSELIPRPQDGAAVPYAPLSGLGLTYTNLPLADPDGRRLQTQAVNDVHPGIADAVNREIELYAIVAHPASRVDPETGELQQWTRLVLVLHDGSMLESGGQVTLTSLARIVEAEGAGPWHPPLKLRVSSRPNRHGGRVYPLVPVVSESKRMPWQGSERKKGGR